MSEEVTKLKSVKLKPETHKMLILESSKRQLEAGKRVTFDSVIQTFLREGTINLNVPKDMAEKIKREAKRRYGTETLEESITKILEEWVKGREGK
ncbi:MAG: hypothetical protein QMD21_06595 [Candidatus Thermoplasmatota archaeon]|nr:hypothetical protein [Candidatus Thermoplasmatota archaeon]